ncbi:hypothetical protein ACFVMC_32345 [Nocardia sp. NPDC127579]|uniref:hypothetical protein n=1 Tax=Nocardia sp. NPDC127579 TaxID=3345402 RepID=UPI00362FA76C
MTGIDVSLPGVGLLAIKESRVKRRAWLNDAISALEEDFRITAEMLGKDERGLPNVYETKYLTMAGADSLQPMAGELITQIHLGVKRMERQGRSLLSERTDILGHIKKRDVGLTTETADLREGLSLVAKLINGLPWHTLFSRPWTDTVIRTIQSNHFRLKDIREGIITLVRTVVRSVDWAETVAANPHDLTPDQARDENQKNLQLIGKELGTVVDGRLVRIGDPQLPDAGLAVARVAGRAGKSLALGESHGMNSRVRPWLAQHMAELKGANYRFVQLEFPRSLQADVNRYLESSGDRPDQTALLVSFDKAGIGRYGHRLLDVLNAARIERMPVVAGDTDLGSTARNPFETRTLRDGRVFRAPYMAAVHHDAVRQYGGPGILLTGLAHTNLVDGLEKYIPGLVSMDERQEWDESQLPMGKGEAVVTPWDGRHEDLLARTDLQDDHRRAAG